jgi:hypothetical protein
MANLAVGLGSVGLGIGATAVILRGKTQELMRSRER